MYMYVCGTGSRVCDETALDQCDAYYTLYDRYIRRSHQNIALSAALVNEACRYIA